MLLQHRRTSLYFCRCEGYRPKRLATAVEAALGCFLEPARLSGAAILLKPNLVSGGVPLACTEGAVLLEAARLLVDAGARVLVGDSPAFGRAKSALARLGLLEPLGRLGVEVDDFLETVQVRLPCGTRAALARSALECDLLVNLPRLKAHDQLRVTMAVKNCFGCLRGLRKPWCHMRFGRRSDFAGRIVEIHDALAPRLHLLDAVVVMHGRGPIKGEPLALGWLAAGVDGHLLDRVVLRLLGLDPADDPLQQAACARHPGLPDREAAASYPCLRPPAASWNAFRAPESLAPVRFSPWRFARGQMRRAWAALPRNR